MMFVGLFEASRISGESAGARMAHTSSFFAPSSAGGSFDIDRNAQSKQSVEFNEGSKPEPLRSKMSDYDKKGGYPDAGPQSGASHPGTSHVRVSMDIAGGEHAAWTGNIGAPERMSLQIRAADAHAPRQSDISSAGTIEELPQSLLTSIPPPPPPYPPSKPPENMKGNWNHAQDKYDKGAERVHPDMTNSGQMHSGVLQAVSRMDVTSDHESDVSHAFSEGGKSKAVRSSFAAERKSTDASKELSSLEMFKSIADDGSGAIKCLLVSKRFTLHPVSCSDI